MKITENLIQLYKQHNGNISAMARELGVSRQAVHQRLKKEGLNGTGNKLDRAEVKLINSKKYNRMELAELLDVVPQTIDRYLDGKLEHANLKYKTKDVVKALLVTKGNVSQASKLLDIGSPSLFRLLKDRNINPKDYK